MTELERKLDELYMALNNVESMFGSDSAEFKMVLSQINTLEEQLKGE